MECGFSTTEAHIWKSLVMLDYLLDCLNFKCFLLLSTFKFWWCFGKLKGAFKNKSTGKSRVFLMAFSFNL